MRDRCIDLVAMHHAHPEAIGLIDESGTAKSSKSTAGIARQYNGNRGKIEDCTVGFSSATYAISSASRQSLLNKLGSSTASKIPKKVPKSGR